MRRDAHEYEQCGKRTAQTGAPDIFATIREIRPSESVFIRVNPRRKLLIATFSQKPVDVVGIGYIILS